MPKCKWKGRFVKQKVYEALMSRSQNARDRLAKIYAKRQLEAEKPPCVVKGNRIVNIDYLGEQMYCSSCKQTLHVQNIEDETINGLGSTFRIRCHHCLVMNDVKSSREYENPSSGKKVFSINTQAALGAIHTGTGQTHLSELFTVMDLPKLNAQIFKKHERIIGPVIEYVAKESCSEATAMERFLTEESIDEIKKLLPPDLQDGFLIINAERSDSNETIVRIFASYDMGWSQRGNGYTYDSLNGYCALIGLRTGKVLDYCTRNRKCRMCDSELATGIRKEHDCRRNFTGSAKAMEADGAVQLVTNSAILKEANVQVGVFIGDNDSSSIAAIQEASNHQIVKQSDMNHSTKNVGNRLYDIHKDSKLDPAKELTSDVIKHIQRCFTFSVHQNKGNIMKVQEAFRNIPKHLFDDHSTCGTWCTNEKENSSGIRLQNVNLQEALTSLFSDLADNASKFASAASSQANESLNHSMCSKAPKGNSYSTSESADYRFSATVAQKNLGKHYLVACMDVLNITAGNENLEKHAAAYEQRRLETKQKCSLPEFKKKRLENKNKRAQLRNRKEKSENHTYSSGMGLIDHQLQKQNIIQKINISTPYKYESSNLAIIFFDLETNSLKSNCDILQMSMKCHEYVLNIYITPTQSIQPAVTKVNGFSKVHKKLFQHGQEVPTLSKAAASQKIIEYLSLFEKKCVLVAHNCNFDSTRLITMIKQLSLLELYEEYIYGFCDTLKMFRDKFPKRKTGYKLTTLATELMHLDCDGAHDAEFDVSLMEQLCLENFSLKEITDATKTIYDVMNEMDNRENTNKLLPSFQPMGNVISLSMQKKLASHGISYSLIVETFKNKGEEETKSLLENKVNGRPTIMKTKQNITKVISYLNTLS